VIQYSDILAAKWMLTLFFFAIRYIFLDSDSCQTYWDKRISKHVKISRIATSPHHFKACSGSPCTYSAFSVVRKQTYNLQEIKRKGRVFNSEEFTSVTLSTVSQYGCTG